MGKHGLFASYHPQTSLTTPLPLSYKPSQSQLHVCSMVNSASNGLASFLVSPFTALSRLFLQLDDLPQTCTQQLITAADQFHPIDNQPLILPTLLPENQSHMCSVSFPYSSALSCLSSDLRAMLPFAFSALLLLFQRRHFHLGHGM